MPFNSSFLASAPLQFYILHIELYKPYEGLSVANQKRRKLVVFDRKL